MCGILALISNKYKNTAEFFDLLEKIQHRGQDASGIACTDNTNSNLIGVKKMEGVVKNLKSKCALLNSNIFLGHTRYITSGDRLEEGQQHGVHPIVSLFHGETYAFVFNGNIPFISSNFSKDTEFIKDFIRQRDHKDNSFKDVLISFVKEIPRAFNIIFLYKSQVYAIRDVYGTRPFKILKSNNDDCIYLTSEDYFLESKCWINVDVSEGSLSIIDKNLNIDTITVLKHRPVKQTAHCVFEHIYFMNENSMSDGFLVKDSRVKMGHILANNEDFFNDLENGDYLVSSVPQTSTTSAKVYAKTLDLEYNQFIKKNKNSNRTFIENGDEKRNKTSKEKYIIDGDIIRNRNIIIVDDSIVRGITIKNLIENLKKYEPKSIHVRVTSPPITNTCNLGIDIPTEDELIYNSFKTTEKLETYLDVQSLRYLKVSKLKEIFKEKGMCMGCINGDYNTNPALEW